MRLRAFLLGLVAIVTFGLAAQAQLPGVNSTLNTVFTYMYEASTNKPTYSTSASVAPNLSATDVCALYGSATKTVRVRRLLYSGAASVVQTEIINIIKRSTAVATTSTAVNTIQTAVPYDSGSSAATAYSEAWTGIVTAATQGTPVGVLAEIHYLYSNLTTGAGQGLLVVTFGQLGSPLFLRGVAQNVVVNHSGISLGASGAITCTWEWTEE